ncbi:NAD(P)-dependent oxidoreductase [Desulfobacterota bacterium AH_259_B03_O07]|nr:NAD(P)-dependent oxidoreductase [Desulfobacterota bacterium AH_259_B03_O07]
MKVFIAGATGVLGRRIIKLLISRGQSVVGLVRSERGEQIVKSIGGESRSTELFDSDALAKAGEGCDVVIHAATSIPVKVRTSQRDWEMNDRIRREGTKALTTCAGEIGARQFILQSVVWVARPSDDSFFNEDSPTNPDPVVQSALDAENIAQDAADRFGFNTSILRCGWFYCSDAANTRQFGEGLTKRMMPMIGSGDAIWSILHVDDAASAFVTTFESSKEGIWHVIDDQPVTVREFLIYFAEKLGAPRPRYFPVWLVRLIMGKYAVDFFTNSTFTSNKRIKQELGWSPHFPTFKEGIDQITEDWKSEGFLVE